MTTTEYTTHISIAPRIAHFENQVDHLCESAVQKFAKIQLFYQKFHAFFALGILFELMAFIFIFHYFPKSSILAFFISGIFLSIFSYFVLLSYFQVKKPQQFAQLKEEFLNGCKNFISVENGPDQYHFSFSHALHRLVSRFAISNTISQNWIKKSEILSHLFIKWKIWTEWRDLLKIKELLLLAVSQEHFALIKCNPTDIETHASLADTYRLLSKLYVDPRKLTMNEDISWMPKKFYSEEMLQKSTSFLERALEELLIVNDFASHDPWVHAQLASVYEELKMPEKEMLEYEKILELSPEEKEILFRLGVLYFEQGQIAKGLRTYEKFKKIHPVKAHELIGYYDAYKCL